jgi:YHS domain-containing protein
MALISQYWIWVLLAVAGFFFLTRMAGCGMGHSMSHGHGGGSEQPPSGHGPDSHVTLDPVSRHNIATGGAAVSAVYRGRAYYFENRENRDAFEQDPEKYLATAPSAGQAVGSEGSVAERPRHRHGC